MSEPVNLVDAVEAATAAMHWLTPSDAAAVDLARAYAAQIQEAAESSDERFRTKMLGWCGPHLLNTLRALGGTPDGRASLNVEAEVKGKLALLRERRGA